MGSGMAGEKGEFITFPHDVCRGLHIVESLAVFTSLLGPLQSHKWRMNPIHLSPPLEPH